MLRPRAVGMRFGRVSSIYSSCFASVAGPPPKVRPCTHICVASVRCLFADVSMCLIGPQGEQSAEAHIPTDTMQEAPPLPPIQVTTSLSNVKKTLKKDSKALESRMSRFHMDSVFPGKAQVRSIASLGIAESVTGGFAADAGVPSMKPLKALPPPEPRVTTLENGLRVATQEMYSPVSL